LSCHEEAIAYYDKVLAVLPDDLTALLNRGFSLGCLKRYEEALQSYDRAGEVDPSITKETAAARSRLFVMMGRNDEAFLAAQGVRDRDMPGIIAAARTNDCTVFHQFCDNEFTEISSRER